MHWKLHTAFMGGDEGRGHLPGPTADPQKPCWTWRPCSISTPFPGKPRLESPCPTLRGRLQEHPCLVPRPLLQPQPALP